jgi:E3 ubiquitin-protein ligase BRE1
MEVQREIKKENVKKVKLSGSKSAVPEKEKSTNGQLDDSDAEMLKMTLTMLRCSVCKDRFKNAAITRCFHLFCKECIDENLRNRHRKCPACGEKFGQDDVKTLYFTH